ncbi:MAG: ATP synthase F1 subunit delta [Patescibacteria group bacterium]|jgi:F-type H+-transporting ATPase subunit delta
MQKISPKKYAIILHQVLSGLPEKDITKALKVFVKMVARNKSLSKADRIIRSYQQIADREQGVTEITVMTATDLDQHQHTLIAQDLKKMFGEHLRIKQETDAGLIGGVKLKYGDTIVDGSIRQRLQALAIALTK